MDRDRVYLLKAFEQAEMARAEGTFPIGAIIVDEHGELVSVGRNKVFSLCDTTAHAEVEAIRKAGSYMLDMKSKRFNQNNF